MKKVLKLLGILLLVLVLLGAGGLLWARFAAGAKLSREIATHEVGFPIPFPLDSAEVAELALTPEGAAALALERAVERGRHLVESRYVCVECHGRDFGGGVMVDDPMLGRLLGPNITAGAGGKTAAYTPADWDRIVRHGVKPDGRPGAMPSEDFRLMSDEELSDVIAYIRSVPPVDAEVAPVKLGPLGNVLVALGELPLSADIIGEHQRPHLARPPVAEVTLEFGEHLSAVCSGCHLPTLAGGKVPGGDPSWPPSANLTPVPGGLGDWTYEDFVAAMREGRRPDGTELQYPMSMVASYTRSMTDTELSALWAYLRSLPPTASDG